MADSDADGAATVEKARFDGLMSAHQRALGLLTPEQRAGLKAGTPTETEIEAQTTTEQAAGSQPEDEYEDGQSYRYDAETRTMVADYPPTARRHNEARDNRKSEPTLAEQRQALDTIAGKPTRTDPWGDITAS